MLPYVALVPAEVGPLKIDWNQEYRKELTGKL
jgi:hypothetical protein